MVIYLWYIQYLNSYVLLFVPRIDLKTKATPSIRTAL